MIGLEFEHVDRIHLVWGAVVVVGLLAWAELRGRDALARFVSAVMQRRLADRPSGLRRGVRLGLVFACLLSGIIALMRPYQTEQTDAAATQTISADVMVVLDVSRSMLAEDAAPNRLARAKAEIAELAGQLEGNRLGIVAFAGRASILCPLTTDQAFFRMILRGVDTRSVSRGGTRIGDGLRKALSAFDDEPGSKIIVLITDGEDHDSFPRDAATAAAEAGVRIIAIGFGSEKGSEITLIDPETKARTLLTDSAGQVVISRLDGQTLRDIALETEGAYVPAGVAALDLESIVRRHIKPIVREAAMMDQDTTERIDRFQWFVLAALGFLIAAVWVGATTPQRSAW